jgi:hypothetical protein
VAEARRLARFLINVNLDRAGEQRPPGLQIGLHPRIAGHPLAVDLEELVGLVLDLLDEAGRVVNILQQTYPLAAERLLERRSRLQQRREVAGIRRRQCEFELHGSPHRLRFYRHGFAPVAGIPGGNPEAQC